LKFFTQAWWAAGCENADEVFQRYESYLCGVREHLPPALVALEAEYTLHDAELKRLQVDACEQSAVLVLDGWNRELQYQVRYVLSFAGVRHLEQRMPEQEFVEQELGDLGYWECEWLGSATEIRMLFVSSASITIRFDGFSFEHERRSL